MNNQNSNTRYLKVSNISEEVSFTEKQLKVARAEGDRRWIVTLKEGTKYEVYGTFSKVLEVCNALNQDPVSVVSKRHQPTLLEAKDK